MSQKVLVTYGDGHGPSVIRAAESIIQLVAPDLDLYHAKIGADAYESTSYALPPETMELIADCDAMLSGPVIMDGIPERDPIFIIKKQMGLYLEYGEFFPLGNSEVGKGVNTIIMSPTPESTLNVYETESLDGVASEYYTSIENMSKIFSKTMMLSEMSRRSKITLISDNILYPIREKLMRAEFRKHLAATEFELEDLTTGETTFRLAHRPETLDALLCDIHSATCVWGLLSGLIGGSGLMPKAYLGDRMGLFMPSPTYSTDPVRKTNPTSAILSAAVMLKTLGRRSEYEMIRNAVCEMYRLNRVTTDLGGNLNAEKFTVGVKQLILTEFQN